MPNTDKATVSTTRQPPLCVDLDGTLVKTDLLHESLIALARGNPLRLLLAMTWLLKGKAHFKAQLAQRTEIDVEVLPYQTDFLDYLRNQKASGRELVLATASHIKPASAVARHLALFDRVLATQDGHNLSGINKQQALVQTFGERGFDYAGNAAVDLKVWAHARKAVVVAASPRLARQAAQLTEVDSVFAASPPRGRALLRALRPHQWLKNLLILVPLLASHRVAELPLLLNTGLAFLAFCLCASSVYLVNDLLDLPADRRHHRKKSRPFAAGDASLLTGSLLALGLLTLAFAVAISVSPLFLMVLSSYYVLTLLYSFRLKQVAMLDVVVLAALYTLRIIAGAAAIAISPSFWLLSFSMFLFLSLAMVKRYAELETLGHQGGTTLQRRGYRLEDQALVRSQGAASGYLSVLVLALYINSEAGAALYREPRFIWLLCPLLLYWIGHIWFKAYRDEMHDDPLVFATRDWTSRGIAVASALVIASAIGWL